MITASLLSLHQWGTGLGPGKSRARLADEMPAELSISTLLPTANAGGAVMHCCGQTMPSALWLAVTQTPAPSSLALGTEATSLILAGPCGCA